MRFYLLLGGLLWAASAWAQQPELPGAPQPPAGPAQIAPSTTPTDYYYVPGRHYAVTLRGGSTLEGVLINIAPDNLEFETKDLGRVVVPRANLLQTRSLDGPAQPGLRPDYYDIGNGNRLFFGPTARNLRQGEGVAQNVWLYLTGINYGLTDNISVGGYVSLVPGVRLEDQFVMLTPKVSLPLRANLHAAAGVLYMRVPDFDGAGGTGAGLLYGALTSGSADNNVTVGLGYGFAGGDIGATPALLVGGQRRVSRKVSLLTENYLIANSDGGIFGLYGLKLNWRRTNLGVAAGYFALFGSQEYDNRVFTSYVVPVYLDFSFRFGKPYRKADR